MQVTNASIVWPEAKANADESRRHTVHLPAFQGQFSSAARVRIALAA